MPRKKAVEEYAHTIESLITFRHMAIVCQDESDISVYCSACGKPKTDKIHYTPKELRGAKLQSLRIVTIIVTN